MACIEARGLRKVFGTTVALDNVDLRVEEGRILGLIGPNGAGKTTALNAILGLTSYEGNLTVLGRDPWNAREELMRDVSFIADVAVLPRWIRVTQLLDYVAGVHPKFDRATAEGFLAKTTIKHTSKVRQLSKGMVAQLQLSVLMAIDAILLVLDEPTLGLDILYLIHFYSSILHQTPRPNRLTSRREPPLCRLPGHFTGRYGVNCGKTIRSTSRRRSSPPSFCLAPSSVPFICRVGGKMRCCSIQLVGERRSSCRTTSWR